MTTQTIDELKRNKKRADLELRVAYQLNRAEQLEARAAKWRLAAAALLREMGSGEAS